MTGCIGGTVDGRTLERMSETLYREDWYEWSSASDGRASVGLLEHENRDADANVVRADGERLGVVYGVVSNRDQLGLSWSDLFERVDRRPDATLGRLEGPFCLAVVNAAADRITLATDKAGSRPLYYTTADGCRFGTELKPLLDALTRPTLDEQAVSDLLTFGSVLGERTVVEGISALPPATRCTYEAGTSTTERYWEPDRSGFAPESYPTRWLDTYRLAMSDVAATTSGPSMWLSGGVHSRVAAGTLADLDCSFETLTYTRRGGRDTETAGRVAGYLDVPNHQVDRSGTVDPVDAIEAAVEVTDGMVSWSGVAGLPFVMGGLHDVADVVYDTGRFLGADGWACHLDASDSVVEALYEQQRTTSAGRVRSLLSADVDPLASLRSVVADSPDGPTELQALDASRRLDACSTLRANAVQRSQVGTRVLTHGPMFETALRMPARYRVGAAPLTDGHVSEDIAPIARSVVCQLDRNLAGIPCEPTGVAPRRSSVTHVLGTGLSDLAERSQGTASPAVDCSHSGGRLRSFLVGLLDAAADRTVFDAVGIHTLTESLLAGEPDAFSAVAAITGFEHWAQRHLDTRRRVAPLQRQ